MQPSLFSLWSTRATALVVASHTITQGPWQERKIKSQSISQALICLTREGFMELKLWGVALFLNRKCVLNADLSNFTEIRSFFLEYLLLFLRFNP